MAIAAAEMGLKGIVVPYENAAEAAVVENLDVIAVNSLSQAAAFFAGQLEIEPTPSRIADLFENFSKYDIDFSDVRGQEMANRAITIAAAGNHNILMLKTFNRRGKLRMLNPMERRAFLTSGTSFKPMPLRSIGKAQEIQIPKEIHQVLLCKSIFLH